MKLEKVGEIAFFAMIIIAILAGLAGASGGAVSAVLVVLGIIVGLLNVTEKETTPFLIAAIVLIVAGTVGFAAIDEIALGVGTIIDTIVANIATFVAPAAIIVALKAVYALASRK